jgi:hypothetical protein
LLFILDCGTQITKIIQIGSHIKQITH